MYAQKNILCNQKFALSKTMIEQLLKEENLTNYKFYYMLPDYKITNVIFTDNFLPNVESIHRDFTYGEEEFSTFNEIEGFEEILKENKELFKFYSNSYFIEIGKSDLEENDIKFVTYTNIRKEKYRIKTIIYKDRVEKTYNNEKAEAHINQIKRNIDIMNELKIKTLDTYENEKIISKYVENGKSYDKILLEYLEQENNEKFFSEIKEYQNRITKILKNVDYEQIKENYKKHIQQNSQLMLIPEVVTLTHQEMEFVRENKEMLVNIGFDIEEFGENTLKINGIPDLEYRAKTTNIFLDILDEMLTNQRTSIKDIEERFIATVACKAAVKANMDLTRQEVDKLIQNLLSLNNPYTCPHGRPTTIKISREDLKIC